MAISKQFVTAGLSVFTIEVPAGTRKQSGEVAAPHYTFMVEHAEATEDFPAAFFVKSFTGTDNQDPKHYTYLGKLDEFTGQVRRTPKSAFPTDSFRFRLLNRVLARVWGDDHAAYEQFGFRTKHEGRCGKCGHRLTTPESIDTGLGPTCAKAMGVPHKSKTRKARKSKKVAGGEIDIAFRSEHPDMDLAGFEPTTDDSGDVVYWTGTRNGSVLTVFNDAAI